ncbi:MAG: hypothetical protein ACRECQ_12690, partial [Burkholderiaceae bacterium]
CMNLRAGIPSLASIFIGLLLCGCAPVMDARIERMIAAELPRVVGPAARYDVDVEGAREDGDLAEVQRMHVMGSRVARENSPVIDRIEVTASEVVYDRKQKRVLSLAAGDANVRLLPSDIAAFLDAKPGLDNVVVTLYPPYELTMETHFAIAGFALPGMTSAKVRGRLIVSDGKLTMEVVDVRVAGFPVGTIPIIIFERLINPLVDLSAPPVAARVTSVQVMHDAVVLTASSALIATGAAARAARRDPTAIPAH